MAHPNVTERVRFGEWQASDLPQAQLLWGAPDVTRLISKDGFSPQMITDRLALEVRSLDQVQYWPLFAADGDLIGCCGLYTHDHTVSMNWGTIFDPLIGTKSLQLRRQAQWFSTPKHNFTLQR